MKTVHVRPSPSYRNMTVFRSAERLLNAPPSTPVKKRAPRWTIFSAGIALGLALALGLVLKIRHTRLQVGPVEVSSRFDPAPTASPPTLVRRDAPVVATSPALAPGPIAPTPLSSNNRTKAVPPANNPPVSSSARVVRNLTSSTSAPKTATAVNSEATLVPVPVAEVTLRGELRSTSAVPVPVEIILRRAGSAPAVSGVIYFLDGDTTVAVNILSGKVEGYMMSLQETASSWTRPGTPPVGVGRSFAIQLPAIGSPSEITGSWVFGTMQGTLTLRIRSPL